MSTVTETSLGDLLYRGKVRDTYDLGQGTLLMVATDRISAFDVVLPNGIPNKGTVLSAMSAFWFNKTQHIIHNHLIGMANVDSIRSGYADNPIIKNLNTDVASRSMIIKQANRIDIECIVRGYITGSAWKEYSSSGTVSGLKQDSGLVDGSKFDEPLFTPTTKADEGHDENMTYQEVIDMVGSDMANQLKVKSLEVYKFAQEYALSRGIILADTKLEFGILNGELILIDEILTPDSSRFWDAGLYKPGESLPNYDKQFVRDWLSQTKWDKEPPAPELPDHIVSKTSERYFEAYEKLIGTSINTGEQDA